MYIIGIDFMVFLYNIPGQLGVPPTRDVDRALDWPPPTSAAIFSSIS